MFGDDFEIPPEGTKNKSESSSASTNVAAGDEKERNIDDASDEVMWEFKWEDKEDAPIYGPHSSSEMSAWVTGDFFKDGVFVRKHKQTGGFYSSKRIDFDLYC